MKFNRRNLIARIDTLIKEVNDEAQRKHDEALSHYEAAKAEWLAGENPQYFINAGQTLVRKAKGRLITRDDLEPFSANYRSTAYDRVFQMGEPPTLAESNRTPLHELKAFLETVEDDEVTSSGLRDVGFKNIANILRRA